MGARNEGGILYSTSRDGNLFSKGVRVPTVGTPQASHPQIAMTARTRCDVEILGPAIAYGVMAAAYQGLAHMRRARSIRDQVPTN